MLHKSVHHVHAADAPLFMLIQTIGKHYWIPLRLAQLKFTLGSIPVEKISSLLWTSSILAWVVAPGHHPHVWHAALQFLQFVL